jgi:hypothetical protein
MKQIYVLPRKGRDTTSELLECCERLKSSGIDACGSLMELGYGGVWIPDLDESKALVELRKAGLEVVLGQLKCLRHGDPIQLGEHLIEIATDRGIKYAHDRCVPRCPRCHREILPGGTFAKARSTSTDREGLPIVEHDICPPH